jgi:hypothetical protein
LGAHETHATFLDLKKPYHDDNVTFSPHVLNAARDLLGGVC